MSTDRSEIAEVEDEAKTSERRGVSLLAQGTVYAHNVGQQNVHAAPHRQTVPYPSQVREHSERAPEMAAAISERSERSQMQQLMETMQQQMYQHAQQMLQMHKQIAELTVTGRGANRTADTLPTPMTTGRQVQLTTRPADPHRASFGMPSFEETPVTPTAASRAAVAAGAAAEVPMAGAYTEAEEKQVDRVLHRTKGRVSMFYGDSSNDKGTTVMEFVEALETVLVDCSLPTSRYLGLVRQHTAGRAQRWFNSKHTELVSEAKRDGRDLTEHPIDWHGDMRRPFIQHHLGTDTVELWLSKISALRLGSGKTKTPVELEGEFDSMARHVCPPRSSAEDQSNDLLLAMKYSDIIMMSRPKMYEQIVMSQPNLTTLKQWKAALVQVWSATERINAMYARNTSYNSQYGNRGGRGR